MKKKIVMLALSLIMATSVITGCGKSDEEKARDEIMSHMSDDEKDAIAADQKEMANYEAEKQAQADAIANEEPIDYSEVLTDKALSDVTFNNSELLNLSINTLLPEDEYIYSGKGYEDSASNGTYYYGQNHPAFYAMFAASPIKNVPSDAEDLGNYLIYVQPDTNNSGMNLLIVAEKNSDFCVQINFNSYDRNDEFYNNSATAILNKNYEYIKEQLQ